MTGPTLSGVLPGQNMGGHDDRPVWLIGSEKVAKRYPSQEAARMAAATMLALWESSFGARRTPPGLPHPYPLPFGSRTVTMERLIGPPLSVRGVPAPREAHRAAATLLADLHDSRADVGSARDGAAVLRSLRRKARDLESTRVGAAYHDVVDRLVSAAPSLGASLAPSHGDFSPRNVVMTQQGARLIDFDRFRMADPARDVTYWGAWHWATVLLGGYEPSWAAAEEFTIDYCSARRTPFTVGPEEIGFHRAAALLRIVHGWSVLKGLDRTSLRILEEAVRQVS